MTDPILADLNDAQREAVTHAGSPLLVVAGAGSGKTRVITRRIAWQVRQGLWPSRILAITFTNKAAGEMRTRVDQLLGPTRVWISTFHAFGARILRQEAEAAGLHPQFTIFDAEDQQRLVRDLMKEAGLGRDHRPGDVIAAISAAKNAGEDLAAADGPYAGVLRAYEQALADNRAVDFDDLLCRTMRLLRTDAAVRERVAGRFRMVLIDEYQDTNGVQYELVRLLAGDHGEVCATGDPDQAIYRWRGADVRNILEFERDFPGTRVVKLEENYRSTNSILAAASELIRHNTRRIERELRSSLGPGEPIEAFAAENEADEARTIAQRIRRAVADGHGLDDIAIFYRTNACSRAIERALRDADLPYVIVGAVEFYERREVKDLIAYLRVLVNPANAVDLLRILNVPSRGIGAATFARLREEAARLQLPIADVLLSGAPVPGVRSAGRKALQDFARLIEELRAMPRRPVMPILARLLALTDYVGWLREQDDPLVEDREENVAELLRALREYDEREPDGDLERFLAETALTRSRADEGFAQPRVTMMTLHAAKGLEFPVVFLAALEEGILPHSRSCDSEEGVEEERRLLYVGITRAQRRLTLSWARYRTALSYGSHSIASRFLRELPQEVQQAAQVAAADESAYFEPAYDDVEEPPFASGDRVFHDHFGEGRVLHLSGFGPRAKVTVDFGLQGTRQLILEYARLRKARG